MYEQIATPAEALTTEQLRYDFRTQFAELVDGSMRTEFELSLNDYDLISEDGRSMNETTEIALDDAKQVVKQNPNLWFEVRRRSFERQEFLEQVEMAAGNDVNTMIVASDFPPELLDAENDVGGYNVKRKQTMLRVMTRRSDGKLKMYSQSLDGSNRQALEAIYGRFDIEPDAGELLGQRIKVDLAPEEQETLVDELTGIYDRSLAEQFGGEWRAGRRPADYRNTYDFVCRQHDLIEESVRLEHLGQLTDEVAYNIAATMNKRFRQVKGEVVSLIPKLSTINRDALYLEIGSAGNQARQLGIFFSACGVTLGAEGRNDSQFESAGYGNKITPKDCEFVSKKCPVCGEKNAKTKVKDGKYYHDGKNCSSNRELKAA